jgi:hypothetical protein
MAKVPRLAQCLNIFSTAFADWHTDELIFRAMDPWTDFPDECEKFALSQSRLKYAVLLG